jgi:hypothetical protein|tara:strand:+ start:767 stop:3232 length:2466 start_codon:yes stop_codon:yes gene_type:complete
MAKTDQELALEEINNRQYMYGGLGPFSQFLSGERREIIRPETTQVVGFGAGPTGVEYITETVPAEYGPVEYDPSYSPARRGLSALGDILYEAPSFFGLRGPDEQVEAMQGVGSSLRDALFGSAEYMSEQARAAASGGEYFDPETGRTVAFDPTITMFGGNPAEGAVMGSGIRAGRAARVRPYEQFGGNLQEARDQLGVTAEAAKAYRDGRQGFKSEVPSEIREAAEKVYNGEMNVSEYNEIVRRVLPPETIGQVLEVPTLEQIALALDKPAERTGGIIGLNVNIPDGTPASSRLDIPAYERAGTWIATVHEGNKQAGSVLGYGPTAVLNNVTFTSKPKVALDIARDASTKTTIGRMDGAWENRDPKVVEQQVRDILNGTAPDADQWVEVGMNPIRGSFFYDKKTFQPVGETEQVLQVGPVVLAKRPSYIELDDPRNQVFERGEPKLDKSGNPIFFSGGGRTGTGLAVGSALREFGGAIPEVDRDTELLMRVGDPRSVNEMSVEMTDPVVSSAPIISAEDLVDRPFITGMSDTSRSGLETVTSVNNVPVNAVMRGGKYFGLQPQNLERGIAFASAPGAVMGQLNRAEAAQALGGRPVAFIPFGMRPASPDFATMSTDIMVPYAQQVMSRSDKIALDRRIREGTGSKTDDKRPIPDWVGIDNATPEYLQALGGDRKAVTKALDEFRDAGSLSRSQARAIVTDPTQFQPVFGDIDMIYELDPRAVAERRFLDSDHPSYESALMGRPLGALRDTEKVNIFEFNPLAGTQDTGFYNFRQKQLDAGRDFPIGGALSSPTMKAFLPGGHGIITRDMVDDLVRRGLVRP